jgi:UDP-N-acetylglucosamine 1-carboxyvinyltransferase
MSEKMLQKDIGAFIKALRERRGMTQEQFAKAIGSAQSAVVRMEKGEQNLSLGTLMKVSEALNQKIISLSSTDDFRVEGGRKLSGTVVTNASKNGALGLLFAALLNKGKTTLHGMPRIEELNRIIEVLVSVGISVKWTAKNTLEIRPPKKYLMDEIDADAARKTRSVLMMLGPMIHHLKEFKLPSSGGCRMGARTISAHRIGFQEFGVGIVTTDKWYQVTAKNLKPADIVMYESSDTGAENLIMAAALIPGTTTIRYAPPNYQVQEVCFFLERCGVKIEGIGSTTLVVHGISEINQDIEYTNSEDPIESMMFISAAVVTSSELTIERCPIRFLELELLKLKQMGLKMKISKVYAATNGRTELVDITVHPSKLTALRDKIHAQPYPGINTDNLPFFVPIATQAKGMTMIHDWMWENRAIYFTELNRLGASVTLADPHRVFVHGPTPLKAAQVVCPPALRPAMIIFIAMLAAEGTSILRNVYSIARGYEGIAERLNAVGAKVEMLRNG